MCVRGQNEDLTANTIVTAQLARVLADRPTFAHLLSTGIHEARLIAAAGTYSRVRPAFIGADRATSATRRQFETYTRVLNQSYGPLYRVALRDAVVVGQGSVITKHGALLWESAAEFLAHGRTPDGLRAISNDRWQLSSEPVRRVAQPCLLVKRPWFRNFGHWLVDCAALLAFVGDDVARFGWSIVTGVYDDPVLSRIVNETLMLLAPDAPVLQQPDHEPWLFTDLQYVMPVHVPPLFKLPASIQLLRESLTKTQQLARDPVSSGPKRIYLSRQDTESRRIVNEAELKLILSHVGFEPILLAGRSLSEQADLFGKAEAIIGIKGAALTNSLFCRAPCSVMVLSPGDFPDPFFWDIAGQLELRYGELFCPVTTSLAGGRNDFVVDPIAVLRMIDAVLGGD
jgi:capsular polysaccharide biosynthesis protein